MQCFSGISGLVLRGFFPIVILPIVSASIFYRKEFILARKSVVFHLSDIQKTILRDLVKRRDTPQHLVRRIRIVLLADEEQYNTQIAPQVGLSPDTVRSWRTRWLARQETLQALEAQGDEKTLKDYIVDVALADDPYNGDRSKYTPEQITQLYALACKDPQDFGRPISHWSLRELADEMVKQGIVEALPISTVWDFLKSSRLEAAQNGRLDESKVRRSRVSRA
jgi:putative transposase